MNTSAINEHGFGQEFERQMLISERRRTAVLCWSLVAIFLTRLIYQGWHEFHGEILPGRSYALLVIGCWIVLEWLISVVLSRRIRDGKGAVSSLAYLSATIDIAMPTIAMAIMCYHDNALNVLSSSVNYVYFIVIILSPLRPDTRLCIFTGVLAAISYGVLVVLNYADIARHWRGSAEMMHFSFFMRGSLLLLGGFAAGFVSHRIRLTIIETLREIRERERILALFGQHVSPKVVNQLLSQPKSQESEMRDVCVMVLDIRNFTQFSQHRKADEVVLYLTTLWSFMVQTVNEHHGIVNKFLGDGFLAIFGAPLATDNNSANGIRAARQILEKLTELVAIGAIPPTEVGLALHAGEVIVGNVGSAERKEYTVIGDVVNVAFRIEAMNKEFGSKLLISEAVRTAAGFVEGERIPDISTRGRSDSIELFKLA